MSEEYPWLEVYVFDFSSFPPDPPEPKPYCTCSCCGEDIYDGSQHMYRVNDDLLCEDCFLEEVMDPDYIVDVTDPPALADLLEIDMVYADDAEDEDEP